MSHDIFETEKLLVTAFVGNGGEPSVQIGMKGDNTYAQLSKDESLDLCHALLSRVICKEGYKATD